MKKFFLTVITATMFMSANATAYCAYLTGEAYQRCVYEEQRQHQSYMRFQQDAARAAQSRIGSALQDASEWQRQQPCQVYHHQGYLGGPEQPDSISVFDRNC